MDPQKITLPEVVRLIKRSILIRFKNNWFNLLLVSVLFYVATQRTFNFEFTIGASTLFSDQQNSTGLELKPKEQVLSLGNFSFITKNKDHETKSANKAPYIKQGQPNSEINPDLAFAFVFFDDASGKHPLDPAIIAAQQLKCDLYIRRFAPVAVSEMKKYGVPASIKMAQAILESNAGQLQAASELNNHFGIRCFSKSCKNGHCAHASGTTHKSFFRKYENAWTSFRAHSLFVTKGPYQHLRNLGTTDYKSWAFELKKVGYSTDPHYAEKLIRIIEGLELHQLDE